MRYYKNILHEKELAQLKRIFQFGEHFVTLRKRDVNLAYRFKLKNEERLIKEFEKQEENTDFYITKYRQNNIVDTIILDFDHKRRTIAYKDVKACMKYLKKHDLSCMVVDSTNKGFHLYIKIPPYSFNNNVQILNLNKEKKGLEVEKLSYDSSNIKDLFIYYQLNLIGHYNNPYESLDTQNLNAGLGGIIRLPYSAHPATNKRCNVKFNNLKDFQAPTDFQFNCYNIAIEQVKEDLFQEKLRIKEYEKRSINDSKDIVADNDLRSIFPSIFGGKVRRYSNYIYMQCPFHSDNNPSLAVKKDFFYCASCGEKGNIWYLIKKGYLNYNEVD